MAELNYKKYGESGEVIIILHGIFGMLDNWHNIAKTLSEQYTVYTLDARNHGQSIHTDTMGYASMGEDVIEFADRMKLENFILMGHSMGGKTAMWVAQNHADRINKLIIVDIAPKAYPAGHRPYFTALKSIDWSTMQTRKDIDEALMSYESNIGVRLFLAKNIERNEQDGFAVKSNIPVIEAAYEEIIGELKFTSIYPKACLFILGEMSKYLNEDDKPYILKHFPKSQFKTVAEAGHWVHAENPQDFLNVLNSFLI